MMEKTMIIVAYFAAVATVSAIAGNIVRILNIKNEGIGLAEGIGGA